MTSGWVTNANESAYLEIWMLNPSDSATHTHFRYTGTKVNVTPDLLTFRGGGLRKETAIVNALEFKMSAGDIDRGTFKLYGVEN